MLNSSHQKFVRSRSGAAPRAADRPGRMDAREEADLARRWHAARCREARDRLVTANLGLVVAIAQRYRGGTVPLEELIAEGNLGLLHAVDGFDPDCGSRFSTYAAYWIRQGMSRAFAADSPRGHLSGRDRRALSEFDRAVRDHYARTGEAPTEEELAGDLGCSVRRVAACRDLLRAYSRPSSLEQARMTGGDPAAREGHDERRFPTESGDAAHVTRMLARLSGLERSAVELRYGVHGSHPQSIDAIARTINRTRRETKSAIRSGLAKLSRYARPLRISAERPRETMDRFIPSRLGAVA